MEVVVVVVVDEPALGDAITTDPEGRTNLAAGLAGALSTMPCEVLMASMRAGPDGVDTTTFWLVSTAPAAGLAPATATVGLPTAKLGVAATELVWSG